MKQVKFEGNKLMIEDRVIKTFDYSIEQVECYDKVIVVVLKWNEVPFSENVYGVDYDGKTLWQIHKYKSINDEYVYLNPFVGLVRNDDKTIWALNIDGIDLLLDIYTGREIDRKLGK